MHEHRIDLDHEREAAREILFLLADAGARWGEYDRALDLLEEAEAAGSALSAEYLLKRRQWELGADRALAR